MMKNQGQIHVTLGSTKAAAVVAWDGLIKDELLDALDAVLDFLEGNHKSGFTVTGLRSAQDVRVRLLGESDPVDLDLEEEG